MNNIRLTPHLEHWLNKRFISNAKPKPGIGGFCPNIVYLKNYYPESEDAEHEVISTKLNKHEQ